MEKIGTISRHPSRPERLALLRLDGIAAWEAGPPRTVPQGYPDRRQRLIALGNAVVPAIPELIGRAILARAA